VKKCYDLFSWLHSRCADLVAMQEEGMAWATGWAWHVLQHLTGWGHKEQMASFWGRVHGLILLGSFHCMRKRPNFLS